MRRFKSVRQAQRFLAAYGPIREHFRPKRHKMNAADYRVEMQERFVVWNEVTSLSIAA
jgi:putative transposase